MSGFTFQTVPEIHCEEGLSGRLHQLLAARFAARSVFIVTDPGIAALGLADPAIRGLKDAGYFVTVFDGVSADPGEHIVLAAAKEADRAEAGIIIGFGGGSSMDVAKLVAALASGQQGLGDMYGNDRVTCGRLPLVQMPTTAGTGSEVTSISVITTGETTKSAVVSPVLYADMALLDPALTTGLPREVTAATGIDAMVHAIEAFTSATRKNMISDGLALRALSLLGENLVSVCQEPENMEARKAMLVGSLLAGQAFANAPVGAVHALAYPLGGIFHIPHGLSNALVLPHVLRFNKPHAAPLYAEIAMHLGLKGKDAPTLTDAFITWMEGLIGRTGIERRLRDVGIAEQDLDRLAREAMLQERLLVNNPCPVSEADARRIYGVAW